MLANSQKDYRVCIVIADQCALLVSLVLAIVLRSYLPQQVPFAWPTVVHAAIAFRHIGFAALWYLSMRGVGAYELNAEEGWGVWRAFKGVVLFTLVALAIAFFRVSFFSRGAILIFVCLATALTVLFRHVIPAAYRHLFPLTARTRVLLIGGAHGALDLSGILGRFLKCQVIVRSLPGELLQKKYPDLLRAEMEKLLEAVAPDEVILDLADVDALAVVLNVCNERRLPWHFVPSLDQLVFGNSRTDVIAGIPLVSIKRVNLSGFNLLLKRLIDITVSTLVLVLTSPLMAAIWLAVRLTSPGPAIFVQKRIGRKGNLFDLYKFRSMKISQDQSAHQEYAKQWIRNQPYAGASEQNTHKISGDTRLTPIGSFLRKYSLDELPQIVNVLKGDMSLVGPRPAIGYEVEMYQEWHKERLEGIPGLTGEWQVGGRYNLSFEEMVKLDLEYLRNWTPARDFKVLLRTVPAVLQGTGK
jgi:exopolysaccharide biosynthesis polyprenyl glycosylphosphotransferase